MCVCVCIFLDVKYHQILSDSIQSMKRITIQKEPSVVKRQRKELPQLPVHIWMIILEILQTPQAFNSLYCLTKKMYNSTSWRYTTRHIWFKMIHQTNRNTIDLSYVTCLTPCICIVDSGLEQLKGIHTLNLSYCRLITDDGLEHLKGIHTLNLSYCRQITDNGLEHLKGIHTLNLSYCDLITDDGLKHLKGIHMLDISCCDLITADGLEYLNAQGFRTLGSGLCWCK